MKFTVGLLLIAVSAFLIAGLFIFLNSKPDNLSESEKQDALNEMLGRKANLNPEIKAGNMKYEGKYSQFSYPASAEIYDYERPGTKKSEDEEKFSFDMQNPRLIFNYSAVKTIDSNLKDIPAVKLRQDKSRGYKEGSEKINGISGLVFSKERSGEYMAEKSVFLLSGGVIYTISITGASVNDIDKLYDQVIKSFSFK